MVRFHGIFINQPHIKQGQIIQETLDRIRVKVVPSQGFGPEDIRDVTARVQQRLGASVKVEVETVSHIPVTSAGKFKAVVSLLKDQQALKATQGGGF
jgi:phenylacetate-CoA ligase